MIRKIRSLFLGIIFPKTGSNPPPHCTRGKSTTNQGCRKLIRWTAVCRQFRRRTIERIVLSLLVKYFIKHPFGYVTINTPLGETGGKGPAPLRMPSETLAHVRLGELRIIEISIFLKALNRIANRHSGEAPLLELSLHFPPGMVTGGDKRHPFFHGTDLFVPAMSILKRRDGNLNAFTNPDIKALVLRQQKKGPVIETNLPRNGSFALH